MALLRERIFCGHCGRRLGRSRSGGNEKHKYMVYKCPSFSLTDHTECFRTVNEIYINQAVKAALRYQIQLAVESKKTYGAEFYQKLEQEVAEKNKKMPDRSMRNMEENWKPCLSIMLPGCWTARNIRRLNQSIRKNSKQPGRI